MYQNGHIMFVDPFTLKKDAVDSKHKSHSQHGLGTMFKVSLAVEYTGCMTALVLYSK